MVNLHSVSVAYYVLKVCEESRIYTTIIDIWRVGLLLERVLVFFIWEPVLFKRKKDTHVSGMSFHFKAVIRYAADIFMLTYCHMQKKH